MQFLKSVQLKTTFLLPFLFDIFKKLNNLPVSAQSTTTRTVTYYFPTLYFFNYSILYVHNSHYIKKQIRYIDYLNLRYRFFLKVLYRPLIIYFYVGTFPFVCGSNFFHIYEQVGPLPSVFLKVGPWSSVFQVVLLPFAL